MSKRAVRRSGATSACNAAICARATISPADTGASDGATTPTAPIRGPERRRRRTPGDEREQEKDGWGGAEQAAHRGQAVGDGDEGTGEDG